MIPWLCTSIASSHRPRGKESLDSFQKELSREGIPRSARIILGLLVSIGFVCLLFAILLSCYVAFFNRECLGETRSVSKEISPKEKEA
jgi:hypothetical protein